MSVGINHPCQTVEVLGIQTAYYQALRGKPGAPTLVLLHGSSPGACSDLNWFRNFNYLAEAGYDVLAFDQPGFGLSSAPQDHSIEFRYRHAQAFLEAMNVSKAVLFGNSLGGLLAVLLDHRVPKSQLDVKGMVLAAQYPHFEIPADTRASMQKHLTRLATLEPKFESVQALCGNTFANKDYVTDDLVNLRLSMLQRNYPAFLERGKVGMGFDSAAVRAQKVTTPSLIVWGIDDHSLPMAIGLEAMNHFVDAQYFFLPRCGHWPQTEHAAVFNRISTGYVADLLG